MEVKGVLDYAYKKNWASHEAGQVPWRLETWGRANGLNLHNEYLYIFWEGLEFQRHENGEPKMVVLIVVWRATKFVAYALCWVESCPEIMNTDSYL